MKTICMNVLKAIGIICYFLVLILASTKIEHARLVEDIKVFSGVFLVVGMLVLERAYKKDSGVIAITAIELLVIAFYSLSIMHMVNFYKCDFKTYLLVSAAVASTYYVVKGVVIWTKDRKKYLDELSDISDIVKKDEPIKKEAKKRGKEND